MTMNKYSIVRVVGEGSFAKVVLASSNDTGTLCAIKVFKPLEQDEDTNYIKKCVTREIAALRKVRHKYIVNLVETFYNGSDTLHMVFDYLPSNLLEALQEGKVKPTNASQILFQLCAALEACHSSGVLHRDVKPDNILVSGDLSVIKLCDFGIARDSGERGTLGVGGPAPLTEYVSTRWYRAPELLFSSSVYDSKADMWAVGCVGAELLMGKPLFDGVSELEQVENMMLTLGSEFGSVILHHVRHHCAGFRFVDQNTTLVKVVESAWGSPHTDKLAQMCKEYCSQSDSWRESFVEGLLQPLLKLDPLQRFSAQQAIQVPLFDELLVQDPKCGRLDPGEALNSMKLVSEQPSDPISDSCMEESHDMLEETIEEDDDLNAAVVVLEDATGQTTVFQEEELSEEEDEDSTEVVVVAAPSGTNEVQHSEYEEEYSEDSDHDDK